MSPNEVVSCSGTPFNRVGVLCTAHRYTPGRCTSTYLCFGQGSGGGAIHRNHTALNVAPRAVCPTICIAPPCTCHLSRLLAARMAIGASPGRIVPTYAGTLQKPQAMNLGLASAVIFLSEPFYVHADVESVKRSYAYGTALFIVAQSLHGSCGSTWYHREALMLGLFSRETHLRHCESPLGSQDVVRKSSRKPASPACCGTFLSIHFPMTCS